MPGTDTCAISVFYRVIKFGLPKSQAMIITDKKSVIMRAKNCKSSFLEKTVIQVLVNKKRSYPYSPKTQISVSVRHLDDVQILAQSINIILPIPKVTCRHQNISKLSPWFTVAVITALSIIPIRIISIKSFQNLQLPPHLHAWLVPNQLDVFISPWMIDLFQNVSSLKFSLQQTPECIYQN